MTGPPHPAAHDAGHGHGKPGKLRGGHWVTIHGHPIYIKGGKVVAGGVLGLTHHAEHGHPLHGPDATPGVHATLAAKAAEVPGGKYEHGPPRSAADREHLAKATASGKHAVAVEVRPVHEVHPNINPRTAREALAPDEPVPGVRRGDTLHVVGGAAVASTYEKGVRHGVAEHYTYPDRISKRARIDSTEHSYRDPERARRKVDRLVREHVRGGTETARLAVPDPAELDPHRYAGPAHGHVTTFRLIHP